MSEKLVMSEKLKRDRVAAGGTDIECWAMGTSEE